MYPLLKPGDEVLIDSSVSLQGLSRGDIIAVRLQRGNIRLHRFLGGARDGRLVTQGDNSAFPDPPEMWGDYLGRLVAWRTHPMKCWMRPLPVLGRFYAFLARCRPRKLVRFFQWLLLPFSRYRDCSPLPDSGPSLDRDKGESGFSEKTPSLAHASSVKPERRQPLEYQELGLEAAIHDPDSGEVHLLNAAARAIWQWSREGLSPEGMVERLAAFYPTIARDTLAEDVKSALDHLRRLRLVPGDAE